MSDQKPIKHYNTAHVIGRVQGVPETKRDNEGKGPNEYLRININCASRENGNVIAFGQMRNRVKWEALLDHIQKNPGAFYHLQAFYNQFPEDRGNEGSRRLSSFFFWDWCEDKEKGADPRAVFILKGVLTGIEGEKVSLELNREKNTDKHGNPIVELFDLFALAPHFLNGVTEGDTVEVVGELMSKGGGDRFGRTVSNAPILPYIRESVKVLTAGDGAPF
ncbi:MAG TPA: hypothetical protein DCS05_02505 [Nitrospiraceae bacterium]|nr:hypothetical protein [Nitrospiraceae bacterium]